MCKSHPSLLHFVLPCFLNIDRISWQFLERTLSLRKTEIPLTMGSETLTWFPCKEVKVSCPSVRTVVVSGSVTVGGMQSTTLLLLLHKSGCLIN